MGGGVGEGLEGECVPPGKSMGAETRQSACILNPWKFLGRIHMHGTPGPVPYLIVMQYIYLAIS